jgi:hypothetical protein
LNKINMIVMSPIIELISAREPNFNKDNICRDIPFLKQCWWSEGWKVKGELKFIKLN